MRESMLLFLNYGLSEAIQEDKIGLNEYSAPPPVLKLQKNSKQLIKQTVASSKKNALLFIRLS
jgi:hypothetical protein